MVSYITHGKLIYVPYTSKLTHGKHGKLIYVPYTSKLTHGAWFISHVGKLINSW